MLTRVAKEFDFHAAHVLPNHDGQCSRRHGHTYKLRVVVEGRPQDVDTSSSEGMVIDFAVLKDIYKAEIEPFVEHQDLNETLVATGLVLVTTCEFMVEWIASRFYDEIGKRQLGVRLVEVRLYETPTSYAEVLL